MSNIINNKSITVLAFTLLFLAPFSRQDGTSCTKGCVLCYGERDGCVNCCRRKFNTDGQCNSYLAPATDNCVLYSYNQGNSDCSQCRRGYYHSGFGCGGRITIPNCIYGYYDEPSGSVKCSVCGNAFYPSRNLSTCIPGSRTVGANPLCVEGIRLSTGTLQCNKCKAGYIPNAATNQCLRNHITGCLVYTEANMKQCYQCDGANGYFMLNDSQTKCIHVSGLQ